VLVAIADTELGGRDEIFNLLTELGGRDEIFNLLLQGIEESSIKERAALVS
jgi:hypothetical protein